MPDALVTTVGGTASNSYVSVAQADTFFDNRLNSSDWTGASADNKTRALLMAKDRLEQEEYLGFQNDQDQALSWPRAGTYDKNDDDYLVTEIPPEIKDSQCELALVYLKEDFNADSGLEGFKNVKVASLDVTPRYARQAGELPAHVYRELSHLLATPSQSNVRVARG